MTFKYIKYVSLLFENNFLVGNILDEWDLELVAMANFNHFNLFKFWKNTAGENVTLSRAVLIGARVKCVHTEGLYS